MFQVFVDPKVYRFGDEVRTGCCASDPARAERETDCYPPGIKKNDKNATHNDGKPGEPTFSALLRRR